MVKYSEGNSINVKLFADDTSLFPVIHDSETFANVLNKDLDMIHNWVFQWNILTQTLPNKLKKSFLVVKQKKLPHPPLVFNNANVNKYMKAPKHHTRLLS